MLRTTRHGIKPTFLTQGIAPQVSLPYGVELEDRLKHGTTCEECHSPEAKHPNSLQPPLRDLVLVPAEVVAEFVEEGGAHFIAVVVFFLADPLPQVG